MYQNQMMTVPVQGIPQTQQGITQTDPLGLPGTGGPMYQRPHDISGMVSPQNPGHFAHPDNPRNPDGTLGQFIASNQRGGIFRPGQTEGGYQGYNPGQSTALMRGQQGMAVGGESALMPRGPGTIGPGAMGTGGGMGGGGAQQMQALQRALFGSGGM